MSPTKTSAPRWTLRGVWPARSRAEVVFYRGEEREVEQITRRLLGRHLETWQYAGLAGAPDDARVQLSTYDGQLYIETGDPVANRFRTFYLVRRSGADLVVMNDGFHIHLRSMQRRGLGLRIFHRQLENAKALGVSRIEAIAGRRPDENGYYTWPRFGFDGPLPREIKENLPPGFEHARGVLDLMESEKGRLWWREHGTTIEVTFDVADQSRSRKAFERYVRDKLKLDHRTGSALPK